MWKAADVNCLDFAEVFDIIAVSTLEGGLGNHSQPRWNPAWPLGSEGRQQWLGVQLTSGNQQGLCWGSCHPTASLMTRRVAQSS